jgi:acyl-CoA synthetase (AMP-forming)/AMP-acid ligase II
MNVVEPIFLQSDNKPSELALCAPGTDFNIVSYARLRRSVNSICRQLISTGIAPRNRFAVLIDNPILHALVLIALMRLGVVTISIQGMAWPVKLDGVIADKSYEFPGHRTILADPAWTTDNAEPIEEKYLYRASPDDVCRLFLTSGTNGHENVIAMTNRMIATRLDRQKLFLGPRAPFCDRTCVELPFTAPLGFQVLLATLWRGGALVMTRDVRKTIAALATYNVKNLVCSPTGLLNFTDTIESLPQSHSALEAVFCAGPMQSQLACERGRARLCPNLTIGYVAADATMVASMPADFASGISGAAGYVVPGVAVEVVDEQGCALPPGNDGNVRIRSDYGVTEYLENPLETQRAFRDGWFYPGNRGRLTRDNMLILAASTGGLLAVGNEPDVGRIEDILSGHTNVLQCGVVAVVNEAGAAELCACVVPRSYLDVEALRSYCKARLPSELVPSRFVAFADLPRSDKGKIDRAKLPALLKNNLN